MVGCYDCKTMPFITGYFINKYYFPILTPIGIVGNVLSFLVSVPFLIIPNTQREAFLVLNG